MFFYHYLTSKSYATQELPWSDLNAPFQLACNALQITTT